MSYNVAHEHIKDQVAILRNKEQDSEREVDKARFRLNETRRDLAAWLHILHREDIQEHPEGYDPRDEEF